MERHAATCSSRLRLAAIVLTAAVLLVAASAQATDVELFFDMPATVGLGQILTVDIWVTGNSYSIYGVVFTLPFDNTMLAVLDDDGETPGIQIALGNCPYPDYVHDHTADNEIGEVNFWVMQIMPRPPCSGGHVATIRFEALSIGETELQFSDVVVVDQWGYELPHAAETGFVTIGATGLPVDGSWSTVKALYR